MTNPPKQPSAPGVQFDYARKTQAWAQQRGAAGQNGSMTTKGFVPNRVKPQLAAPGTSVKLFSVTSVHDDFLTAV